jgi:sphinganine-1-phosphate aldolase
VDLHKYAYTPKGASLLLHRSRQLRRTQYFSSARWPGYTMINSTLQSTKSGGPLAAAWAVTRFIGDQGYAALARQVRGGLRSLVEAVDEIAELRVVAEPVTSLVALAVRDPEILDVFTLADELQARGWYTQPQLRFEQSPATLHLSLSAATVPRLPAFLMALQDSVTAAKAIGPVRLAPASLALVAELDADTLDEAGFGALVQGLGLVGPTGLQLPERMAPINALLDAAPAGVREALLVGFVDQLSRPVRAGNK